MSSINLLPNAYKRVIGFDHHYSKARLLLIMVIVTALAIYALAIIKRRQVERETAALVSQSQQQAKTVAHYDLVAADAKELAKEIDAYYDIIKKIRTWPIFFDYLQQSVPPDVSVSSINTTNEKEKFTINLAGLAGSKRAVGVFREKLLQFSDQSEAGTERVSQVVIESVTANTSDSGTAQAYNLSVEMSLKP